MSPMLAALLAFCGTPASQPDAALHALSTEQAAAQGRREKSIEAIEKAIKLQTACPPCRKCGIEERVEIVPGSCPLPASTPATAVEPRLPTWVWYVVGAVATAALGTGIGIGVGIAEARR